MNVAELKNLLRYAGMSPLKLNVKIISPLGNVKYNDMLDVDYAGEDIDGRFVIECYRSKDGPMRCHDLLESLERYGYKDYATVTIRVPEKMLAKRLATYPDETVYELDVTGISNGPWDMVLHADKREEKSLSRR